MGTFVPLSEEQNQEFEAWAGQSQKGGFVPLDEKQDAAMDLDDRDVKRQPDDVVFDGSTYKPGGDGWNANDENRKFNDELYNSVGEQGPLGRQQKVTVDGEERTYLVPPTPSANGAVDQVSKVVAGAGLDLARSVAGLPEAVMNNISGGNGKETAERRYQLIIAARKDGMPSEAAQMYAGSGDMNVEPIGPATKAVLDSFGGKSVEENDSRFVDANFPRMPQDNGISQAASDIISVGLGAVYGGNKGMAITKASGAATHVGDLLTSIFKKASDIDPKGTQAIMSQLTTAFGGAVGGSVGATVATPGDAVPISQEGLGPVKGFMPEHIEGMDDVTTRKIGHFVDNMLMSGVFKVFGMGLQATAGRMIKAGKNAMTAGDKGQLMQGFMKIIDPTTAGVGVKEMARRGEILESIIRQNADVRTGIAGIGDDAIDVGATEAVKKGARQYVEQVFTKPKEMPDAEWAAFVDREANDMVGRFVNLKRTRTQNSHVQNEDARINDQAFGQLNDRAMVDAPPEKSAGLAQQTASALLPDLQFAGDSVTSAKSAVRNAEDQLGAAGNNAVERAVQDAQQAGWTGDGFNVEEAQKKLAPQLYDAWKSSYDNYLTAKEAIPDAPLTKGERMSFTRKLATIGREGGDDVLEAIGLGGLRGKTVPTINGTKEAMAVTDNLDGVTIKKFVDARAAISKKIEDIYAGNNAANLDVGSLQDLRTVMDDFINNGIAGGPGREAFDQFKVAFREHADKWRRLPETKNLEAAAKGARPDAVGGMDNFNRMAFETMDSGFDASSDILLQNITRAAGTKQFTDDAAKVLVNKFVDNLVSQSSVGGAQLTAQQIKTSLNSVSKRLKQLGVPEVGVFQKAVDDIAAAENNLRTAKGMESTAIDARANTIAETKGKAASRFLRDIDGEAGLVDNTNAGFEKLFTDANAPTRVSQFIKEAQEAGSTEAVEGVRGQFLRWLGGRVTGKGKTMGVTEGGTEFVQEAKGAALKEILDPNGKSNVMQLIDTLYSDDEPTRDGIKAVLNILNTHLDNRSMQATAFGSNTAMNNRLQDHVNTLIKLTFGPLDRAGTTAGTIARLFTGPRHENNLLHAKDLFDRIVVDNSSLADALKAMVKDLGGSGYNNAVGVPLGAVRGAAAALKEDDTDVETKAAFKLM